MKIKYNFSLSQEWSECGLDFTERVCERHNLDMIQLMDILDELTLFTRRDKTDNEGIVCWLAQNERTFIKCDKWCVDNRIVVLKADLNYKLTDEARNIANKYGVGFDNENYYELRAEITVCKAEG